MAIQPDPASLNPINEALRWLGVERRYGDELDAVGLGSCRKTEQWLPWSPRRGDPS